jgi:hypothetical protein
MDPNVKLLIEEAAKQLHAEIKEGFTFHEGTFTKCLDKMATTEHLRDAHLVHLEEAITSSDKALAEWRPGVDASIASVKLELSKLNNFFACEAKASPGSQQGLLATGSALVNNSTADGLIGYHICSHHHDCEFGCVFTQTHDPVKVTVHTSPLA